MNTPARRLGGGGRTAAAAVAAAAAAAMLLLAGAAPASTAAEPADPGRITIEGRWRAIAPGETQRMDEVRCPGTHPFVFNEMYGSRPWLLTPGVEVIGAGERSGDLAVDLRAVITRADDRTVIGIGPAERNRVTLSAGGEAAEYRVDVHCTSEVNDSYA